VIAWKFGKKWPQVGWTDVEVIAEVLKQWFITQHDWGFLKDRVPILILQGKLCYYYAGYFVLYKFAFK
jgi:hypothetical protein